VSIQAAGRVGKNPSLLCEFLLFRRPTRRIVIVDYLTSRGFVLRRAERRVLHEPHLINHRAVPILQLLPVQVCAIRNV